MRVRRLAVAASSLFVTVATQNSLAQAPEYHGLSGEIAIGEARWRLDDGHQSHLTVGLLAGYRVHLFDIGSAKVSLTPRIGLTASRFRGIDLNSRQVAFARVDKPSAQLAVRLGPVRPYLLWEGGNVTIERYVGSDLINYWGSVMSQGLGVEFPRNNPCSAGLDVAVRRMTGTLSNAEWRGQGSPPPGGSLGATIVTLGWTGRFRGARLLFDCH